MFRILWDPSSGSIKRASLKLLAMFCVRSRCLAVWNLDLRRVCLNSSHQTHTPQVCVSFKILIHVDFNLLSFIQLSALVSK